jgi:secondary thiamine-phosphate synthase enzyme
MRQGQGEIEIATRGKGLVDITSRVAGWLARQGIGSGLLTIFIRHTSASLTIQENADPDVLADLEAHLGRAVPEDRSLYAHSLEGPDDMPAHIRAALTGASLSIPVSGGAMVLGSWQGIYVWEHRDRPHGRRLSLHVIGE